MPANDYRFVERWTFPDYTPGQVYEVLANASILPEWWTGVYLEAVPLRAYEEPVVGAKVRARARGFLPYTLAFELEALRLERGRLVEVRARGDFEGVWRARLRWDGRATIVDIEWAVVVEKPLIRWLSPVLKPLFAWNHDWTTPRGERGMLDYLARTYNRYPIDASLLALSA